MRSKADADLVPAALDLSIILGLQVLSPELWLVKLMVGAIDPTYDEQGLVALGVGSAPTLARGVLTCGDPSPQSCCVHKLVECGVAPARRSSPHAGELKQVLV